MDISSRGSIPPAFLMSSSGGTDDGVHYTVGIGTSSSVWVEGPFGTPSPGVDKHTAPVRSLRVSREESSYKNLRISFSGF